MPGVDTDDHGQLSVEAQSSSSDSIEALPEVTSLPLKEEAVVEIDLLPRVEENRRVYLEWKDVSCFVPNLIFRGKRASTLFSTVRNMMNISSARRKETEVQQVPLQKKQILFGLNGHACPGEILALMGPSGSGKTTLISMLGGRTPKLITTEGKVTFNGVELNKSIRRSIGYVLQDDLLYENLTVYETLYYAALLKLPKTMSRAEKIERVEAVISSLGLSKCRDTLIGGGFRRGVSGGERKRVSVGHELLTNPSVLFLDEPTSGLDSTTALRLVSTLKSLADGGRIVVTTIHQPSSRLFQRLTNVMFLNEGSIVYYGSSQSAVEWFDQMGFPLPDGVHVADFILDICNGDIKGKRMDGESVRASLTQQMADYLSTRPYGFTESKSVPDIGTKDTDLVTGASKHALLTEGKQAEKWGASFLEQIKILLSRAARNRRFSSLSYQEMFHGAGIAALLIVFWWKVGEGNTFLAATDISSLLFFLSLYLQYGVIFKGIYTFPNVFRLMVKERSSGMYRLSAFYLAESCCDLPLDYLIPAMCFTAVYWGIHLRQSFFSLFISLSAFILGGLNVQTIGLLVGISVENTQSAVVAAILSMVGLTLGTGYWVRNIPSSMSWYKFMTPTYWAYRTLLQTQFQGKVYYNCGGLNDEQLPLDECTVIADIADELNIPISIDQEKWPAFIVLVGSFLFLRMITYYVLRIKTK